MRIVPSYTADRPLILLCTRSPIPSIHPIIRLSHSCPPLSPLFPSLTISLHLLLALPPLITGVSHEPWFSTPFLPQPLSPSLLTQWSSPDWLDASGALHLPPRNDFIPTDFSLRREPPRSHPHPHSQSHPSTREAVPLSIAQGGTSGGPLVSNGDAQGGALGGTSQGPGGGKDADVAFAPSQQQQLQPRLIRDDARMRVWYKPDDVFFTPRVNALFAISSPVALESAKAAALAELLVKLLADSLNETIYLVIGREGMCEGEEGRNGEDDGVNDRLLRSSWQSCPLTSYVMIWHVQERNLARELGE